MWGKYIKKSGYVINMSKYRIKATLFIPIIIVLMAQYSHSRISESRLKTYSGVILRKIINDNSESSPAIRRCLGGLIKDSSSGIRLVDKLGIFMYDIRKHGMSIKNTRFYNKNNLFSLFIVMKNKDDTQHYTLYLEYNYISGGQCKLQDAYFSMLFDNKYRQVKKFFGSR